LFTTLDGSTSYANQVGFLILGGLGMGPLAQIPLSSAQNACPKSDTAVVSSTVQFLQSIGQLIATAVMQSVLNNRAADLVAQGQTNQLTIITLAIQSVFFVPLGAACVELAASLCMEHVPLSTRGGNQKKEKQPPAAAKDIKTDNLEKAKAAEEPVKPKEPATDPTPSEVELPVQTASARRPSVAEALVEGIVAVAEEVAHDIAEEAPAAAIATSGILGSRMEVSEETEPPASQGAAEPARHDGGEGCWGDCRRYWPNREVNTLKHSTAVRDSFRNEACQRVEVCVELRLNVDIVIEVIAAFTAPCGSQFP
jgi:hypothetical protein